MTERAAESSPRLRARIAGVLYLVVIAAGVSALSARSGLIVRGDVAATAANIANSELLYRASVVADLVGGLCYIAIAALLYELLKPVSRSGSLSAAFLSVAGCIVGAVSSAIALAPLVFAGGATLASGFTADQLHGLAYLSLRMQGQAYNIAQIFFGLYCVSIGYLIVRSTFLPRVIGVAVAIAGLAWLTDSFATILMPALAAQLSNVVLVTGALGEGSLAVWLTLMGVNAAKWQAQATA